jgi:xanthine dehydrogenase YagS FAD-binding subunit
MRHFDAKTVTEAISLLGEYKGDGKIIAGGVDMVTLIKNRVVTLNALVNIKTIPDLAYIREQTEGLRIGILTTVNEVERSTMIRDRYPMLAEAAHSVAAPQLRNMATVGGNLCQEVQCWYYRRSPVTGISYFCYRKGGKRCYAPAGENDYHAILNGDKCYAVCPSDLAPALVALNATLRIAGPYGERLLPLEKFYTPLGNILKPYEMLTEVQVPTPTPGTRQKFVKFRLRKTLDFAIVSVAAATTMESNVVTGASIVLGGIAPTPYRAIGVEEMLRGKVITESVLEASASIVVSKGLPLRGNAYKIPITEALVRRALQEISPSCCV